jgi:hypothetical protein
MKTQEEIEQLALQRFPNDTPSGLKIGTSSYKQRGYIKGYTQCQEDMADKKYTEEDMLKAIIYGSSLTPSHAKLYANNYINSLNKQD